VNINMVRDADDDAGFYAAACAADLLATWPGAGVYHSTDSGVSYSLLASITAESVMGYCTTELGDFLGGNIPDELNSVNVVMTNGALSSTTFDGLLSGVNTAIIGDEILHFRDATLESNGSYTLRGFLRGRRGSEYAMADHAVADRFILFSASTIVRIPQSTADIGQTRLYKPVTSGSTLAATTAQSFTNSGTGLKPYACTHLGGGRNAAGDATLNWSRRGRIDAAWRDSVDVPLGEVSEAYEVEIYTDGTYTTLARTITGITSQTTTYLAATQTTDFGSPQATIYFRVYQLSATVGRGHAASGSV
jgi:hypothetical protein